MGSIINNDNTPSWNEAKEMVNHPPHYGGQDNPYEAIKIIEHYNMTFAEGSILKYLLRAGKKGNKKQDLEKALWYLKRTIERL